MSQKNSFDHGVMRFCESSALLCCEFLVIDCVCASLRSVFTIDLGKDSAAARMMDAVICECMQHMNCDKTQLS